MMKAVKLLAILLTTTLLVSSCATYSCKAPDGKVCKSVSQVYAEEVESQQQEEIVLITKRDREPQYSEYKDKAPLWIPATKLRLWVSRWVDNRGNYHQPGHLFIEVEKGRWATKEAEIDEMIIEGEDNGNTD